jgi:thiamine biosynthesis lipoprotein
MATRFEIVLHGQSAPALRAAGEEALDEVDRLEGQLSLYRPGSEIGRVNSLAARQPVRVCPPVFRLLEHAQRLHQESAGAFDITVAPLVRCWGFMDGQGHVPAPDQLSAARSRVGMQHIALRPDDFTVRFDREGVMLDLGAIGKGYAIERAAIILREAGVASALIHGGTSTVYAIGKPSDADAWKVAIECPPGLPAPARDGGIPNDSGRSASRASGDAAGEASGPDRAPLRAIVPLEDEALSVSAVWGKSFQADGKHFGHVLDPRTGEPVSNAVLAAVVLASATETDALSTALLVAGPGGHGRIADLRKPMRTLVVAASEKGWEVAAQGIARI